MEKGKNLLSFFAPAIVIGMALLLTVSAVMYYLGIKQPLESQAKQLLSLRIIERGQLVEQRVSQIQKALILASDSVTDVAPEEVSQHYKKYIKELDTVSVINVGDIKVNSDSKPIITHVSVDLLNKALSGTIPMPELILKQGKADHVAFTYALNAQQVLLATVNLEQMAKLLGDNEVGSSLALRQNYEGTQHIVTSVGAMVANDAPLVESKSFGANWSVALWKEHKSFFNEAGLLPIVLFLGAILALLIVALMPLFSLKRILQQDARGFIQGVKSGAFPEKFSLRFFNDLFSSYQRVQNKNSRSGAASQVSQPQSVEPAKQAAEASVAQPKPLTPTKKAVKESSARPKKRNELDDGKLDVDMMMVANSLNPEMFREYDIRGIAGKDLTRESVFAIGKAIGSEAYEKGEQKVVVARDGRISSPSLHDALIQGLMASGRDVIDIGMVPTPVLYFATHTLGTQSGVMVTGSHNPPQHNGLKVVIAGETLHGAAVNNLYKRICDNDVLFGQGQLKTVELDQKYIERVAQDISIQKPIKVAIDCGNGVTGMMAARFFQALGCEVLALNTEVDGNFPNHHPDPNVARNLIPLQDVVKKESADIGFAFDGDGDRLGVVDNTGKIIWTDQLLMLFAKDVLSRNQGAEVIYDVKCTRHLPTLIESLQGKPTLWKTGHSLMKAKMRETGALLAGEGSGHVYFKEDWYGFDDALYAAARLLKIMDKASSSSTELFDFLPPSISSEEINIEVAENLKFNIIDILIQRGQFPGAKIETLDGIRVEYPDRWFLVRASNTTPSIVIKFEADHEIALDRVKTELKKQINDVAPSLKLTF